MPRASSDDSERAVPAEALRFPATPLPVPEGAAEVERELAALFARLYPRLRGYAAATAGQDVADDLAQEVFIALWRRRAAGAAVPPLDDPSQIDPFLYRVLRRRASNVRRDRFRLARRLAQLWSEWAASVRGWMDPERTSDADDLHTAVARIVRAMPARCREVFVLLREQGMTYGEVATVLEITPSAVRAHATRANRILSDALAAEGYPGRHRRGRGSDEEPS
jgi:RNA polymerase sigma factor (sigma-70 family)